MIQLLSDVEIDLECDRCHKTRVHISLPDKAPETWIRHGIGKTLDDMGWGTEEGEHGELKDICPDCIAKEKDQ